ncbi:MAG: serine/threonine protein kinase, partial [Candidatus Heimdallarchaeota archaeon]|nr:serine/threonine protein kinase [Candidatus Heimdallarchaeota archaeon]
INKYIGIVVKSKVEGNPTSLSDVLVKNKILTSKEIYEIENIHNIHSGHTKIVGYELIELIGKGGMGIVYRAHQISMDRIVALKIMYPSLANDKKYVERFLREARASAKLNHNNIVTGIDIGESVGIYYFVMEYVDGQSLSLILKRGGALDELRSLTIAYHVSKALEHAHLQGIIHRDIKPDNLMITSEGVPKLGDLGLAKVEKADMQSETGITLGTPNYISPEQAKGAENIDARADIYSLGATLYHMLTGDTPYSGNAATVMMKHVNDPVPDPWSVNENITPFTRIIVMKMMAKNPDYRYKSASDVANALENARKNLETILEEDSVNSVKKKSSHTIKDNLILKKHSHLHKSRASRGKFPLHKEHAEMPVVPTPEPVVIPPPPIVHAIPVNTTSETQVEDSTSDETVDITDVLSEDKAVADVKTDASAKLHSDDETVDVSEMVKPESLDPDETTDRNTITEIREPKQDDKSDEIQPAPPAVSQKKMLNKHAKRGAIRKLIRRRKR